MRKKEITAKQIFLVTCPTCGAGARERCVLQSGNPRNEPHAARKISAIEAIEKNRH